MGMRSTSYRVAQSESKSKGIIKYALYIVLSGLITFYLKEPIDSWAEAMDIPFRGDLLVTMIGITLGMALTWFLLYFYERSAKKSGGGLVE